MGYVISIVRAKFMVFNQVSRYTQQLKDVPFQVNVMNVYDSNYRYMYSICK